jgi:hypothetical protein
MKKDLESELRDALRPVAPSADFTRRLIAQVDAHASGTQPSNKRPAVRSLWWTTGLAASLVIALGVQQHVRAQRELAEGLEARRQVLQALQMTSQKLDLAYEAVKKQSSSWEDAESGA